MELTIIFQGRLLKNLIDNAIRHNDKDAKPPIVSVERRQWTIRITVRDYGDGIGEKHLPHLTEPFNR
ncbi:MAG: sensor histidine kinase [Gammaproteobacteria bacterium]|nr:sensor histidine kinase [Gammaproteobacteria bacterium]